MRALSCCLAAAILISMGSSSEAFRLGGRWSATATDGGGIFLGDPITLTWGIVGDGTPLAGQAGGGQSNLVNFMDGIIGAGPGGSDLTQRPWFTYYEQSFDRWEEVTGITYNYEPNDDGATHASNGNQGILGIRGDVRIAGRFIDGQSGVLAFNFFPNNGDMVLDTGDSNFFGNANQNYRRLRNTIMHEHGHGLGLNHVESNNSRFLMEPFLQTNFNGPQFDDILGAQRAYGDFYEKSNAGAGNDTAALATDFGLIDDGQTAAMGLDARDVFISGNDIDFLSIDDNSDTDFFSFTIDNPADVDISVLPVGPTYLEGPQGGGQSNYVTSEFSDLNLALFDSDQSTLLTSDNSGGLGQADMINGWSLSQPGEYYVRVQGAANNIQMYEVSVSVTETSMDHRRRF